ncbi:MAG TPA: PAS domain S-box protein [Ktedonobacteraceae bacterium]|jgi:PAS domain S-box-containing protein|nr:PAS domain S-box protein [Ktedonobacteraceae bacterium]
MAITKNNMRVDLESAETSAQQSQLLTENNAEITLLMNAEGVITYASPTITPLTGYTPAEIVGSSLGTLVHPADFMNVQQALREIRQSPERNLRAEYRLCSKNTPWRWFEGSTTNLLQVPGIHAIIATFRDITPQNSASLWNRREVDEVGHFVRFYETDEFLINSIYQYVNASFSKGKACVIIATKAHLKDLEERLRASGLDLAALNARDKYFALDAAEVLSTFMVNESPDPERFAEVIGGILARATKGQEHICLFGEMVALLWKDGKQAAAIRLEELWNDLYDKTHAFSLFCAYAIHDFDGESYRTQFARICQHHEQVIPDESYTSLASSEERLRATALLQQKANSLQAEIQEHKCAEEILLYLAAMVESSNDAILSKDLNGIITSWNAAAERMYGYSALEIIGRPVTQLFAPDRQDEFTQIMTRIRRGDRIDHYETTRVRKDGTPLLVSVTISPIINSSGTIIGASAIARDITEQKHLEAKFRQLFDSNLIGVFISNFSGTFVEANNAFLNLLGYTREELRAGAIQRETLTPPEFHGLSQQAVKTLQAGNSPGPYEKEYLHKSGRRIPVLIAVTPIEQTETCIGLVLDISERKELDRRKDEFISMASHELKTPLTSLKGFLSLLQRRLSVRADDTELHYLARMDAQVTKLTKLINDLLDLSKIQKGLLAYRVERFTMHALVQEIVENMQGTTQTHALCIEGHVETEVYGDRDRIGQVLINFLNNAIKYSPRADKVLIQITKDQDNVRVSVQDFGIGIDSEHQQRIFERFYQVADAKARTYPGLGIGLYICTQIVERHHGHIGVESKKGEGSTFYFTLPVAPEEKG